MNENLSIKHCTLAITSLPPLLSPKLHNFVSIIIFQETHLDYVIMEEYGNSQMSVLAQLKNLWKSKTRCCKKLVLHSLNTETTTG